MVRRFLWPGDRAENKRDSARAALEMLLERVGGRSAAEAATSGRAVSRSGRPLTVRAGRGARRAADPAAGERIHVVGAAGAGASAAALLAGVGRRGGRRLRSRRPGPYTRGARRRRHRASRRATIRRTSRGERPPADRLAVTKALTADRPGQRRSWPPRARPGSRSSRGSRSSPTPRPVGAGRRRGDARQEHVGGLARPRPRVGRAGSGGVRRRPAAGRPDGVGVAATARRGAGDAFVVEADEYAGNFDAYRPAVIVLTSAEWDHPDVFADRAAVLAAFEAWIRRAGEADDGTTPAPVLVANVGDAGVAELVARLGDWPGRIVATALVDVGAAADRRLRPRDRGPVRQRERARRGAPRPDHRDRPRDDHPRDRGPRPARRPGPRAAADGGAPQRGQRPRRGRGRRRAWASMPGRSPSGLAGFGGVGRRLERKGEAGGVVVYDDYGHHPTAIRETLAAVRQREPGRRVWAVYEPLTYHRTAALLDGFAEALAAADAVAIADIWAGRDPDTSISSAAGLAAAVAAGTPPSPSRRPGASRRPPPGSPARSGPATPCWSWAAAARTGSASCCSQHLEAR